MPKTFRPYDPDQMLLLAPVGEISADAGFCSEANLKISHAASWSRILRPGRGAAHIDNSSAEGTYSCALDAAGANGPQVADQAWKIQIQTSATSGRAGFGQIRNKGLVRFLLRGEEKCSAEWDLHCIGHNLTKLHPAWG